MDKFNIYFNKKKQWIEVTLWDVHPNTFQQWKAGRWGYFLATYENPKLGKFGEIHLVKSRVRPSLVIHELNHAWVEWMWSRGETITRKNEERLISFNDSLVDKFYKEYNKLK